MKSKTRLNLMDQDVLSQSVSPIKLGHTRLAVLCGPFLASAFVEKVRVCTGSVKTRRSPRVPRRGALQLVSQRPRGGHGQMP